MGDHVAEAIDSFADDARAHEGLNVACLKTLGGERLFCPLGDIDLVRRDGGLRAERDSEEWIQTDTVVDVQEVQ